MRFYKTSKKESTKNSTSLAKLEVFSDFERLQIYIQRNYSNCYKICNSTFC